MKLLGNMFETPRWGRSAVAAASAAIGSVVTISMRECRPSTYQVFLEPGGPSISAGQHSVLECSEELLQATTAAAYALISPAIENRPGRFRRALLPDIQAGMEKFTTLAPAAMAA